MKVGLRCWVVSLSVYLFGEMPFYRIKHWIINKLIIVLIVSKVSTKAKNNRDRVRECVIGDGLAKNSGIAMIWTIAGSEQLSLKESDCV